jgi:hypothetical protein
MNKVYVIWNPLHEKVVCVHSSEELECLHCIEEREKVKDTAYSLEGKWFKIDDNGKKPISEWETGFDEEGGFYVEPETGIKWRPVNTQSSSVMSGL